MLDIHQQILKEIESNLDLNSNSDKETIFFSSVIISRKGNELTPTFILITDEKLSIDANADFTRFNKAKREYVESIAEIVKGVLSKELS